jgi:hypothetical protein
MEMYFGTYLLKLKFILDGNLRFNGQHLFEKIGEIFGEVAQRNL